VAPFEVPDKIPCPLDLIAINLLACAQMRQGPSVARGAIDRSTTAKNIVDWQEEGESEEALATWQMNIVKKDPSTIENALPGFLQIIIHMKV